MERGVSESTQAPPIFVVGVPRSGTTLLRLMLNAHPRIYLTHEASFYLGSRLIPRRQSASEWLERTYFESFNFHWLSLDPEAVRREVARSHPDGVPRDEMRVVLRAVMVCKARHDGSARHGDKTPMHASHLKQLFVDFPDARVVHIVRDPRATVQSLRRMPWAPRSYMLNNRFCHRQLAAVAPFRDRILEIRLEDLVADAEPVMRRVLDFVGEPWNEAVLRHHEAGLQDTPPLPWLLTATEPRRAPSPVPSWLRDMSPAWIRQVEYRNRAAMARHGYPPAELATEPGGWRRLGAVLRDVPRAARFVWHALPMLRGLARSASRPAAEVQGALFKLNPEAWSDYPGFELPELPRWTAPASPASRGR